VHYQGDAVSHGGATYQARVDTGHAPPHGDWVCLAERGVDGRGPMVRGTYSNLVADYTRLDIVSLNGGSFIAKYDNPGSCPGSGWQLLTSQGKRGDKGEKGQDGGRGPKGDTGPVGAAAPKIKTWNIDRARYLATPVMADGSEGPTLELRSLFEQFQTETR
jgi:hypothetical protein